MGIKSSPGFSSRVREKFHRPAPLRKSFVFVEDKSRKYDFVDDENIRWDPKSPLVGRQQLQHSEESQLRLACKLLSEKIERGETATENNDNNKSTSKKNNSTTTTTSTRSTSTTGSKNADSLRHFNTRTTDPTSNDTTSTDSADEQAMKRNSMPVISEMLRGLETDLQEGTESETAAIPRETKTLPKTTKTITQMPNSDDDSAPQHIEEYDPLTSIPTVPDDTVSLERKKSNLMRRRSFFGFGKRKTGLGHYHEHNKGAMAVK